MPTNKARGSNSRTMDLTQGLIRALGDTEAAGGGRRFHLSFSSETPVKRRLSDGKTITEILDHTTGNVDLSRLNNGASVLFNHQRSQVIGHVERAWIENGRGEAIVVLDDDDFSRTIGDKINNGTLRSTSVFYDPDDESWEDLVEGQRSMDGRFVGPGSILHAWTPMEVSIVSIPADPTVGVGRDAGLEAEADDSRNDGLEDQTMDKDEKEKKEKQEENNAQDEKEKKTPAESEKDQAEEKKKKKEEDEEERNRPSGRSYPDPEMDAGTARALEIMGMCRSFGLDPEEYIRSGMSLDRTREAIMNKLCDGKRPLPARSVEVSDENDKVREQIRDAILVRGRVISLEEAVPGTSRFMRTHTRDLFCRAYRAEGVPRAAVEDMEDGEIFGRYMDQYSSTSRYARSHETPTALFPAIVDDAMEKAITSGYEHLPVTYDKISTKISVKDFKEHRHLYSYGGTTRRFEKLPEGGEIKHDNITMAQLPSVHTETYAKQWTMTRELMVNDDIGLVAEIPRAFGEAYRQTINDMVYDAYLKNQNCFDGTPLFSGEKGHKNMLGTGTTVDGDAYNDMLRILQSQTDQHGDRIPFRPAFILVPSAMEKAAYTLFNSPTINMPDNTQAANPYYHYGTRVIVDATIDARCEGDTTPWFLFAEGKFPVELAYLNGNEGLNRRAMQVPGQLGIVFDFWGDVAVNITDFRQVVMNPGIKVPMKYGLAK